MKIEQLTGPFKAGDKKVILLDSESKDAMYLHVGFQIPFRTHFGSIKFEEEFTDVKNVPSPENKENYIPDESPDFTIKSERKRIFNNDNRVFNGFEQSFRLTDRNVLEFDNIADKEWTITFHKDLPRETIIDIAYE